MNPRSGEHDPNDARGLGTPATAGGSDIDAELADIETDASLSNALRTLLQPPEDIEARVADTVSDQLISRSAGATVLDLLGLGPRTIAFLLTGAPGPADRSTDIVDPLDTGRRSQP